MKIVYQPVPELPKLAWIADVNPAQGVVFVRHGPAVECRDAWLVEGVWDGSFKEGGFHRSESFFGSGLVVEGPRVYAVASSALVDRLVCCQAGSRLLVSNSAPLLAGLTGAQLDPEHDYAAESNAILAGVKKYRKDFRIVHPEIDRFQQVYHENVVVEAGQVRFETRGQVREFQAFEEYVGLLRTTLTRIRDNLTSPARATPMTAFTTLSSGYDSTAVATLVRELGVRTCFAARRSNSAIPPWVSRNFSLDDGQRAARTLGLNVIELSLRRSSISRDELYFLAASTAEPELIFHSMARTIERDCPAAVLFTGYHGDKIWDVHTHGKYLSDEIRRGDVSGLNLSEIRLKCGFVNVPVPFLFARSIASIHRIALSTEMDRWRLGNSYDRPIPRRIAEEAGIPREAFGNRKHAVIGYYDFPANRELRSQFFGFIRKARGISSWSWYVGSVMKRLRYLGARIGEYASYLWKFRSLSDPMLAQDLGQGRAVARRGPRPQHLMYAWAFGILSESLGAELHKRPGPGASSS